MFVFDAFAFGVKSKKTVAKTDVTELTHFVFF